MFNQLVFVATALLPLGLESLAPPEPDFDEPVNYLEWFRAYLGTDECEPAAEVYERFFSGLDGDDGFPIPADELAQQINARLAGPFWDPEAHPRLAEYLEACGPAFTALREATRRKVCWLSSNQANELMLEVEVPDHVPFRWAARALVVDSWQQRENPSTVMLDRWSLILDHADQVGSAGTMTYVLVATGSRASVYRAMRAALSEVRFSEAELARAMERVRGGHFWAREARNSIIFEWAGVLDALQLVCPAGRFNADQARFEGPKDCHETARQVNSYFPMFVVFVPTPHSLRHLRWLSAYEAFHDREEWIHNAFLDSLMPPCCGMLRLLLRFETERRATLIVLALHAYRETNGSWPKSLEQLDLEEDCEALEDPYASGPFHFEIAEGEALLYSVAGDGEDDGGLHEPNWRHTEEGGTGDHVYWPFQRDSD